MISFCIEDMKNKVLILITIFLITLFGVCFVFSKISNTNDIKEYSTGLTEYRNKEYYKAYKHFGKVSIFSNIKTPALFRQARCATFVGDTRGAVRNYKRILCRYPNSQLYVVSEYNLAMLLYESGSKSARKHFVHIIKYYPDTDYALASEYYTACIDMERANKTKIYAIRKNLKKKSLNHFIRYVKYSPDGRFVQQSINNITKLGIVITHNDNLLIADSYYKRELYAEAEKYYRNSPLGISWAKYAKSEFKLKNSIKGKLLVENGLKYFSANVKKQDMYEAIDCYIDIYDDKLSAINYLINTYPKTKGYDYLLYLKAKNSDASSQYKIYEQLYNTCPDSSFSPEALYKMFYSNIDKKDYDKALQLGKRHIEHFKTSDTSPAILYWMGKIYEYKNNKITANKYYKKTISGYPDSYYSYRAALKLGLAEGSNISFKPVIFPCENKNEQNMAAKLVELGDYDFVSELYKNNKFVESWVEYKQGNITQSVIIAEKAMKKLYPKPKFSDARWRLVYPLNYYDYVNRYKNEQPLFILLSIIREESHFNKDIKSPAGALGLMQLMPATANEIASGYGIDNDLLNPQSNIRLGCLYYSKIKQTLQNNDYYAILAYNGGFGNVNKWLENISYRDIDDFIEKLPFVETQSYLKKVLRSYWCYLNIYS